MKVKNITAHQILDSRGIPTIRGILTMDTGVRVTTEVPAGKSLSKYEPKELRDNNMEEFDGMGTHTSCDYIAKLIAPKLIGVDVTRQNDVDSWLLQADGTQDRSKLGANTMLTISQLFLKAGAASQQLPLFKYVNQLYASFHKSDVAITSIPSPIVNIINGGKHGSSSLDFQEFHIIPSTSYTFSQSLTASAKVYEEVKKILEYKNVGNFVSEQGGFAPNLLTNVDGLEVIKEAITKSKLRMGVDVHTGLDCAANGYYDGKKYKIKDKEEQLNTEDYMSWIKNLASEYSILILEDPLQEDGFDDWKKLHETIGETTYLAGDDLVAGNKDRIKKAIDGHYCTAVVIKSNQYATITEFMETFTMLHEKKIKTIVSQRFGETTDDLVADLAVGLQADFVKFGSPNRGERVVKYNRLLEIEQEMVS